MIGISPSFWTNLVISGVFTAELNDDFVWLIYYLCSNAYQQKTLCNFVSSDDQYELYKNLTHQHNQRLWVGPENLVVFTIDNREEYFLPINILYIQILYILCICLYKFSSRFNLIPHKYRKYLVCLYCILHIYFYQCTAFWVHCCIP